MDYEVQYGTININIEDFFSEYPSLRDYEAHHCPNKAFLGIFRASFREGVLGWDPLDEQMLFKIVYPK